MSEEFDDIQEEPLDEEQNPDEEQALDENAQPTGKFVRLLGSDSRKFKLSGMFKDWFLDYSSYVILQRAVPHIVDGLKPVQRRVLHAMYKIDDGRYTKVANIVGQAMQYHPHGDASILGALVQLGQKGFAVDCQGNWHELDDLLRRPQPGADRAPGALPAPARAGHRRHRRGHAVPHPSP